jgi:hypothetical protein
MGCETLLYLLPLGILPLGILPLGNIYGVHSKNSVMDKIPFRYGTTVSNFAFTDRENERARLKSNLLSGVNTVLLAPRRWGKSSLVEKVMEDIKSTETKVRTIHLDMFSVGTEAEFLELFAREVIKASSNQWEEWMHSGKNFFKRLMPKLSVGNDPSNDFSISFDWQELQKHADEILNLPEIIGLEKGLHFVICLDEFQNLASFHGYDIFEKKMRAAWQRQKKVTYCLYGSKRHMMADIFNNPTKPFYRFGDLMLLPKIEAHKWEQFIIDGFERSGKKINPTIAQQIPARMRNHAWYVQQLAHYVWNHSAKEAGLSEFNAALQELIQANSPLYQKEIELLSATQVNLLRAVAKGETQLTSTEVMQNYYLGTPNNVIKNKRMFIETDFLEEGAGGYEFVDPAFELWFRKLFFRQDYLLQS